MGKERNHHRQQVAIVFMLLLNFAQYSISESDCSVLWVVSHMQL